MSWPPKGAASTQPQPMVQVPRANPVVDSTTFKEVIGATMTLAAGGAGIVVIDLGADWATWGRCFLMTVATTAVIGTNEVFYGNSSNALISYLRWSDDGVNANAKRVIRRSTLGLDGTAWVPAVGSIPIAAAASPGIIAATVGAVALAFAGTSDLIPQSRYLMIPIAAIATKGAGNYTGTVQLFN